MSNKTIISHVLLWESDCIKNLNYTMAFFHQSLFTSFFATNWRLHCCLMQNAKIKYSKLISGNNNLELPILSSLSPQSTATVPHKDQTCSWLFVDFTFPPSRPWTYINHFFKIYFSFSPTAIQQLAYYATRRESDSSKQQFQGWCNQYKSVFSEWYYFWSRKKIISSENQDAISRVSGIFVSLKVNVKNKWFLGQDFLDFP